MIKIGVSANKVLSPVKKSKAFETQKKNVNTTKKNKKGVNETKSSLPTKIAKLTNNSDSSSSSSEEVSLKVKARIL